MSKHIPKPTDRAWVKLAFCRVEDPEVFFPPSQNIAGLNRARAICEQCPVAEQCLADALAAEGGKSADSRYGVYAGTTPKERARLYHRLRVKANRQSAA
ncbi:Transcription factor WhiB [Streptomyces misionensis]|uniref:Transcriptional regulator WhiB n=1 Tax=Streptomyces misionensis TaxID=67331 RepID=A0A1H4P4Z2_9ACTN|nr:WhiB family transcriptional regulator [Streptomyces misionensis]SEC02537.1 Transcription factor WhiB [Streptomyces misionensis]